MGLRHGDILIVGFLLLCLGSIGFSYKLYHESKETSASSKQEELLNSREEDKSYFEDIHHYVYKNGKKQLYLNSKTLIGNVAENKSLFFKPKGRVYFKKNAVLSYAGERGTFDRGAGRLLLKENVSLVGQELKAKSGKVLYKIRENEIHFTQGVQGRHESWRGDTVVVQGDSAVSKPLLKQTGYRGNVKGKLQRKRKYQPDLDFRGDYLDLDSKKYYIKIESNVEIKRRGFMAKSKWGEVFLGRNNKKFKRFVLHDNIRLTEKIRGARGKIYQRKAYAEQLEGSVEEDLVVLTGRPWVVQFDDVIKGNRIILRGNNQAIEVDDASTDLFLK